MVRRGYRSDRAHSSCPWVKQIRYSFWVFWVSWVLVSLQALVRFLNSFSKVLSLASMISVMRGRGQLRGYLASFQLKVLRNLTMLISLSPDLTNHSLETFSCRSRYWRSIFFRKPSMPFSSLSSLSLTIMRVSRLANLNFLRSTKSSWPSAIDFFRTTSLISRWVASREFSRKGADMQKNPIYKYYLSPIVPGPFDKRSESNSHEGQFLFLIIIRWMDFQHILDNLFVTLNECRMHPGPTAQKMQALRGLYQGRIFKNSIKTREGTRALDDLIDDFSKRRTIDYRLKWSFALHMAADEQATILGERGLVTTEGTNFHKPLPARVQEYAIVKGRLCEVYEFGGRTAEQILEQLLIDDGLMSRKRRNTLMDPIFKYIGIGTSYHESHEACTVIILAEDIISLVAPDASGKYKRRKGLQTGKEIIYKLEENIIMNLTGGGGGPHNSQVGPYPNQQGSHYPNQSNVNTGSSEPHFILDDSSIQPRSEYPNQHRMTNNSQYQNPFDAHDYISRQGGTPKGQETVSYADKGHQDVASNVRVQESERVPEPVDNRNSSKKESKCSLM